MKEAKTFESSMKELEETVKQLEGGNLSLDESLAAYEKAVRLAGFCAGELERAKQKVELLKETAEGVKQTEFPPLES